jgi:ADP-ribose pyrophosphatase YjhB (NUDIX family)
VQRGYALLPRPIRLRAVRLLTPSHTLGALCFLEHDGTVLLLRQRHRRGWTLPGGFVDRGETAAQAVCREVLEETGLVIEAGAPVTTVVDPRYRRVDVLFHVPVGRPVEVVPASEATAAQWLDPASAGDVDVSTSMAFEAFAQARRPGAQAGRLVTPGPGRPPGRPSG